jgi:Tfp pilus assembly protein PilN
MMALSRPLDINILPEQYRPRQITAPAGIAILVLAMLLLGLIPAYAALGTEQARTAATQARLDQAQVALGQTEAERAKLGQLEQSIAETRAQIAQLSTELGAVSRPHVHRSDSLATIARCLIPQVQPTAISQDGNVLLISGTASDQAIVLEYARALQSSGQFANVRVLSIVNADPQTSDVEFSIKAEQ